MKNFKKYVILYNTLIFIFGIIKDDHKFHELFTDRIIDYDNYVLVPDDGVIPLKYLSYDLLNAN